MAIPKECDEYIAFFRQECPECFISLYAEAVWGALVMHSGEPRIVDPEWLAPMVSECTGLPRLRVLIAMRELRDAGLAEHPADRRLQARIKKAR